MTTITSRPLGAMSGETLDNTLVAEMATVLRTHQTNLDDEAAVLIALHRARFRPADVVALAARAADEARRAINSEADPAWAADPAWGGR